VEVGDRSDVHDGVETHLGAEAHPEQGPFFCRKVRKSRYAIPPIMAARSATSTRLTSDSDPEDAPALVDHCGNHPCGDAGGNEREEGPSPAAEFLVHGDEHDHAGHVQEDERHEGVGAMVQWRGAGLASADQSCGRPGEAREEAVVVIELHRGPAVGTCQQATH
jgi:hypothetical protein